MLIGLGKEHPEEPFVLISQISTFLYFSSLLLILPLFAIFENTIFDARSTKI